MKKGGNHSERAHAVLSASSSSRWLNCTPSARLEQEYKETGNKDFANEGTLAHELAELKLMHFVENRISNEQYIQEHSKFMSHRLYKTDMEEATDKYVFYISGILEKLGLAGYVSTEIEAKLDLSSYVQDSFGTADFIAVAGTELHVIDYKHGQGVYVEVENNTQLLLYALGVYDKYRMMFPFISTITVHVVQPRKNNIRCWSLGVEELESFGDYARKQAELAFKGEGEQQAGEWCRWCKVKDCKARADKNLEEAKSIFRKPQIMSEQEISEALEKAAELKSWYEGLERWVIDEHNNGRTFTHIKVEPGRSRTGLSEENRKKVYKELLDLGFEHSQLKEEKDISVTKLRGLVKGNEDATELLNSYVEKIPGQQKVKPLRLREVFQQES